MGIVITYKGPKIIQHLTSENLMLQQMRASEKARLLLFKIDSILKAEFTFSSLGAGVFLGSHCGEFLISLHWSYILVSAEDMPPFSSKPFKDGF